MHNRNNSHLTLEDRRIILSGITNGSTKTSIILPFNVSEETGLQVPVTAVPIGHTAATTNIPTIFFRFIPIYEYAKRLFV